MNETDFDPIANSLELSTGFLYPNDEPTPEEVSKEVVHNQLADMLTKMAIYILPSKNPTLTMIALFYTAGIDLSYILNCPNTEIAIAKHLGIPKSNMSLLVKQIRKQFNLEHSTSNLHNKTQAVYSNNFRKPSTNE